MKRCLALAGMTAIALAASAITGFGPVRPSRAAAEIPPMVKHAQEDKLKGFDITYTGLKPTYPKEFICSPLTSLYASWIDVDQTRRDELHSGIDGGRRGRNFAHNRGLRIAC